MFDKLGEYGIVANVIEPDRVFRNGAKAWITGGTGGEGASRFIWLAQSRGGRIVQKWAPTMRFDRFRAKWVPKHLRDQIWYVRGTREEMERLASTLVTFVAEERSQHSNRR